MKERKPMAKRKKRPVKRGMFILVEGISGSGKTTLAKMLVEYLKKRRMRVILDSEPTHNAIGKGLRKLIEGAPLLYEEMQEFAEAVSFVGRSAKGLEYNRALEMQLAIDNFRKVIYGTCDKIRNGVKLVELEYQLLYIADRYLDIESTIIPALERGIWVVLDRYDLSTYAYGASRGLGMLGLSDYHRAALGNHYLVPDVTLFVDVPAKVAAQRLKKSGKKIDRFERLKSLKAVALAYEDLISLRAMKGEAFIHRVNGNQPKQKVLEAMLSVLHDELRLPQSGK